MYKISGKRELAPSITEYTVIAPNIARRARPGQFVIVMTDERGERVPFTIADFDEREGTVTIIVQTVGATTKKMERLCEGDEFFAFTGPLGEPTDIESFDRVLMVGGGIGSAVLFPQAKHRFIEQRKADVILGARSKELLLYKDEFKEVAERLIFTTDDGSFGERGLVTEAAERMLNEEKYDLVFAVGPLPMMKAVCELTKRYGIKTVVSMNPIMVDGTGMCGGCRLTVGGKTVYACVSGPEFDGHLVDFDEAIARNNTYKQREQECNLLMAEVK